MNLKSNGSKSKKRGRGKKERLKITKTKQNKIKQNKKKTILEGMSPPPPKKNKNELTPGLKDKKLCGLMSIRAFYNVLWPAEEYQATVVTGAQLIIKPWVW